MILGTSIISEIHRMLDLNDIELFIILIVTGYSLVVLFRIFGIYRKGKCPECGGRLNRHPRTISDHLTKALTLFILPVRRYKCVQCGWSGMRWNLDKEVNKGPRP